MLLHAVAVTGKMPIYLSLTLVLLLAVHHCRAEEFEGASSSGSSSSSTGGRSKRGPTVGLFAFPRVGRSDPAELGLDGWDGSVALPSRELTDDYADDYDPIKESKRQGLVPFPRVGRAGARQDLAMAASRYWQAARNLQQQQQQQLLQPQVIIKRASGSGANGGMWFGPRLGKRATNGDQQL
ncbi:cardio acceleratory peptide 2b-like isoform X2 [Anopheles albimanus]|uniref:cardio acceleratory peptide 2b-like isoform X2 n=1 Tax=Anopheles albimanus TaxID=7167 RepID=UPI001641CD5A|nr:cardio acceleratory peptide 2b-like isoform X2 [Anopheles albimanus]